MHCPFCKNEESKVVDSRVTDSGSTIRRRRQCLGCSQRFSTLEKATLYVAKKNGILQEFSKEKLVSGVKKAIQGRPIDDDALATLAQKVEDAIRYKGVSQIDSYDIGLLLLDPLRDLDEVAYLRFASVYQCFDSLDDFEKEIQNLKNRRASVDAL